jgi:hypothetical protein
MIAEGGLRTENRKLRDFMAQVQGFIVDYFLGTINQNWFFWLPDKSNMPRRSLCQPHSAALSIGGSPNGPNGLITRVVTAQRSSTRMVMERSSTRPFTVVMRLVTT